MTGYIKVRWRAEVCQGPELNDWIVRLTELANSRCPVYRPSRGSIEFCKYLYNVWRPTGVRWYDLFTEKYKGGSWDIEYSYPMP